MEYKCNTLEEFGEAYKKFKPGQGDVFILSKEVWNKVFPNGEIGTPLLNPPSPIEIGPFDPGPFIQEKE